MFKLSPRQSWRGGARHPIRTQYPNLSINKYLWQILNLIVAQMNEKNTSYTKTNLYKCSLFCLFWLNWAVQKSWISNSSTRSTSKAELKFYPETEGRDARGVRDRRCCSIFKRFSWKSTLRNIYTMCVFWLDWWWQLLQKLPVRLHKPTPQVCVCASLW